MKKMKQSATRFQSKTASKYHQVPKESCRQVPKETCNQVREDPDLAKKEIDESVPVGSSTKIPKDHFHFGGYLRGRNQEQKGDMGDNMRCLYTKPRSVHCGDNAPLHYRMSVQRGNGCDVGVPAQIHLVLC